MWVIWAYIILDAPTSTVIDVFRLLISLQIKPKKLNRGHPDGCHLKYIKKEFYYHPKPKNKRNTSDYNNRLDQSYEQQEDVICDIVKSKSKFTVF